MNEINRVGNGAYPRPLEVQDRGQNVGPVAGGEVTGTDKVGDGVLVMKQSGAPLFQAGGTGAVNVLAAPKPGAQDKLANADESISAYVLAMVNGKEVQESAVNTQSLAKDRVLLQNVNEVKKEVVERTMLDLMMLMAIFERVLNKQADIGTLMKVLNQFAAADAAEKQAQAASTEKNVGALIANIALQTVGSLGDIASDSMNGKVGQGLQISTEVFSKLSSVFSHLAQYFETSDAADRRSRNESEAEALRDTIQECKTIISKYVAKGVECSDRLQKALEKILKDQLPDNIHV